MPRKTRVAHRKLLRVGRWDRRLEHWSTCLSDMAGASEDVSKPISSSPSLSFLSRPGGSSTPLCSPPPRRSSSLVDLPAAFSDQRLRLIGRDDQSNPQPIKIQPLNSVSGFRRLDVDLTYTGPMKGKFPINKPVARVGGPSCSPAVAAEIFTSSFVREVEPLPTIACSFPNLSGMKTSLLLPEAKFFLNNISGKFRDMRFDCYKLILPYILRASPEAEKFVRACLPENGPIVSYHLGSLLGFVTFIFDVDSFDVPSVNVRIYDGYRFLHLDETELIDVKKFISMMMLINGYVGAGGRNVNPVDMINVAASVGAVTIAANDASTTYRDALSAYVKVSVPLSSEDIEIIQKERMIRCAPSVQYSGDHALMSAYRMIIRQDFTSQFNAENTNCRTFVLGATAREYKLYASNPKVYFQLANKEGKDIDRMVITFLEDLRKNKAKKLKQKNKTTVALERNANDLVTVDQMLKNWREFRKLPQRFILWDESRDLMDKALVPDIVSNSNSVVTVNDDDDEMPPLEDDHGNILPRETDSTLKQESRSILSSIRNVFGGAARMLLPKFDGRAPNRATFDVVLFEDVGYNFTKYDWYKIFKNTGASIAYGYMCLPWQLEFPDIVPPPGYRFRTHGKYSELGYAGTTGGYCNGYSHLTVAWSTLMKAPAMIFKDMVIGVEIIARVGPMACIKLFKCDGGERITRCLALPDYLRSVKILNVRASMKKLSGRLDMTNLIYFPVRVEEFEHAINYAMDVAKESLTFRNVLVFLRRKTSGISLVSKEYTRAWAVPTGLVPEMALVVYLCTVYYLMKMEGAEFKITGRRFNPIVNFMFQRCKLVCKTVGNILDFLTVHNNFDQILVMELENEKWQHIQEMASLVNKRKPHVYVGNNPEDLLDQFEDFNELSEVQIYDCDFCEQLKECVGDQKFNCDRSKTEAFYHDFSLSDDDLRKFRTMLSPLEHDPVGIIATKAEALPKVPVATFSTSVLVNYICGPPGTGKSYAIRAMARPGDLVVGPFSRLKDDYTNFIHPITKRKTSLKYMTQHAAMSALNHDRVFVDEYTAFPYECLAVILFNCGASEVILVGDHRQTALINEVEGVSIESKINLTDLREHELIKNYRNPSDAVKVLNDLYYYRMEATNNRLGYSFDEINNFKNYQNYTPLFFTHASAAQASIRTDTANKVTVRSNQGATYENVVLVIRDEDQTIFNMPSMAIVALSRHKQNCVILTEQGQSKIFAERLTGVLPRNKDDEDRRRGRPDESDDDNDDGPDRDDGRIRVRNNRFNNERRGRDKLHEVSAEHDRRVPAGRTMDVPVGPTMELEASTSSGRNLPQPDNGFLMYESDPELRLPTSNTCLLVTISQITGIPIETVWEEFKRLFSNGIFRTITEEGLSLFHLEYYCKYRRFRISIVKDNRECVVCGDNGPFVGYMSFRLMDSPEQMNMGHFSVMDDPATEASVPIQTETVQVPSSAPMVSFVPINRNNVSGPMAVPTSGVEELSIVASRPPNRSNDHSSNASVIIHSENEGSDDNSGNNDVEVPTAVSAPSRLRTSVIATRDRIAGIFTSPLRYVHWGSYSSTETANTGDGILPTPGARVPSRSLGGTSAEIGNLGLGEQMRHTRAQSSLGLQTAPVNESLVTTSAQVVEPSVSVPSDTVNTVVPPILEPIVPENIDDVNQEEQPQEGDPTNSQDQNEGPFDIHETSSSDSDDDNDDGPRPNDSRVDVITATTRVETVVVPDQTTTPEFVNRRLFSDPLDVDDKGKEVVDEPMFVDYDVMRDEMELLPSTSSNPFNTTVNYPSTSGGVVGFPESGTQEIESPPREDVDLSRLPVDTGLDDGLCNSAAPTSSPTIQSDPGTSRRYPSGRRRSVGDLSNVISEVVPDDSIFLTKIDMCLAIVMMQQRYPDFDIATLALDIQMLDVKIIVLTNEQNFPAQDLDTINRLMDLRTQVLLYRWFLRTYPDCVLRQRIPEEQCSGPTITRRDDGNDDDGTGGQSGGNRRVGSSKSSSGRMIPRIVSKVTSTFRRSSSSKRRDRKTTTTNDSPKLDSTSTPSRHRRTSSQPVGVFFRHIPNWIGGMDTPDIVSRPDVTDVKDVPPEPLAGAERRFLDMARLFLDPVKSDRYLAEKLELMNEPHLSLPQTSFDAYKMLQEEFATVDEHTFQLTNEETLAYVDTTFDNGFFDTRVLDNINQRGHPKPNKVEAWSLLAVAPGVTYFKANQNQTMACLQSRYLTKSLNCVFSHDSVTKANEIADLFFNEHMSFNMDIFNDEDVWKTTIESEHSMKVKNYEKQTDFGIGIDPIVRFNMKDIFKPFKTKIDLFKAGQGISAWSKENQTIFQTPFRLINKHFINCLKPHVVYDNGIDESTLMNRVNALFLSLPYVCVNGVIDATACDSGQNQFTQLIERCILEKMGLSDEFLDWYYMLRERYVLKGAGVTATITGIKTSGEPATLLNNTILMAALMNYLVRGQGPCVIVIKGDDGLKRQANIVYKDELKTQLAKFLKMDFKVDIDVPITFCGYFLYDRFLMPDIVRKIIKILGHKFRDYEHFTEYQESLRDWILNVNRLGVLNVCYVTSKAYDISLDQAENYFESIVSLSHINSKQFYLTFKRRVYQWDDVVTETNKWSQSTPWYTGYN